MALDWADAHLVPAMFPLTDDGYAIVTALSLSLRFQFREDSLHVEEEIFDSDVGLVLHAIGQLPFKNKEE